MGQRIQENKPADKQEEAVETPAPKDLRNEELAEKTEDVLDKIDEIMEDVLGEQEASQFVANYIQRGGE